MDALIQITERSTDGKMTSGLAKQITGGLSTPSKMPGKAYGIPASLCITGSKLAEIPGSVCHGCYALKGMYRFKNTQDAQHRRFEAIEHPRWVEAMTYLVGKEQWFRWHDSGDLQGVEHLEKIIAVVRATPDTRHWMPTREYRIVKQWLDAGNTLPSNLVIRLSAHMIDAEPQDWTGYKLPTSGVHHTRKAYGRACPAPTQGNQCGDCRSCWNPRVKHVSYHKH